MYERCSVASLKLTFELSATLPSCTSCRYRHELKPDQGMIMAFVAKIAPIEMVPGQNVQIDERAMYGGNLISVGERIFIWASGCQGLIAVGSVTSLEITGSRVAADILIEANVRRPFDLTAIAPFRDAADGSPIAGLARMLYRQAHNKVAALDEPTTALLEEYFV